VTIHLSFHPTSDQTSRRVPSQDLHCHLDLLQVLYCLHHLIRCVDKEVEPAMDAVHLVHHQVKQVPATLQGELPQRTDHDGLEGQGVFCTTQGTYTLKRPQSIRISEVNLAGLGKAKIWYP